MLDQIAAAFDRQDYQTAALLLKMFLQQSPQNPWGQFYRARLSEVSDQLDDAKAIYQKLLRDVSNPKVILQARQGIQRIATLEQAQRQQAIAHATADPQNVEPGLLVLEAIQPEARSSAAQALARILNLDVYTARLQLPSHGWRLCRMGAIGELKLYGKQLREANLPVFWATESEMQNLQVFQVQYIQDDEPQAVPSELRESLTVVCQNDQGQLGTLTFNWSEVSQRVEGMLPIFERVVDTIHRAGIQRQRKEQTQDYARICDLHLPTRRCILRICDWRYQFDQGMNFSISEAESIKLDQTINRLHWNRLMTFLNYRLFQKSVWSEFTGFAETAIDYPILLKRFPTKIDLLGQESSLWNSAFHLYSGLAFLRAKTHP